jgi:DNA-binding NarL/FixJ family response regulator
VVYGDAPSNYCVVHVLESISNPDDESRLSIPDRSASIIPSDESAEANASSVELTARETEVLRMLTTCSTTPEIARRLSISEGTVRNHVRNILNKLDVHSRLEAVCLAIRRRLF